MILKKVNRRYHKPGKIPSMQIFNLRNIIFMVANSEDLDGMMLGLNGFNFSFKTSKSTRLFMYPSSSPLHRSMYHLEAYFDNYF